MYAYNPRKKSYGQLEKTLVGSDRWDILNNILKELAIKEGEGPKQHWMIVGPRGIGKSHLMTLLYYRIKKDRKLKKLWIPVLFPEELRMAGNLARFLERTANEILLELEEDKSQISNELRQKIEMIRKVPLSERADSFFSLISWFHQETGKFIILIAENLQQLLGKKIPLIEQKKLRAFLQTSEALLIVGSATTIFNALHDHSHPFYHFFHIRRLEDLDFEDMKTLIANLLSESGRPELAKEVAGKDARLKTLYTFTGGNPRMAVFLSDVLRTEVPDEMLSFMDNILDELTPYFEAILKDIPDSLEEIINTLATFEPAQSPKEIAQHLEAPQTTIRNYLKQLKENGYVRIAFSKGKSNYYCLNEYLYRVWYQMRDSSHREETRWLMELLLMLYSPSAIIEEKNKIEPYVSEEKPVFSYKELIVQTADFVSLNPDYCKVIELCVDSTISDEKKTIVNTKEKELLEEAYNLRNNNQYDKAITICENILEINSKSYPAHGVMGDSYRGLSQYEEAIKHYERAIKINPKSEYAYWHWGDSLRDLKRYEEAIEKFQEAIKIDSKSFVSYGAMGDCFGELGQYDEAEKQYKKAIKINPKYDTAYMAWGICLHDQERYEEAIEKYKKAIKINPKSEYAYWLWGDCLCKQEHYEEAISLFEKHFPESKDSDVIYSYGSSLMGAECYDEALKQFEHIIKIEPEYHNVYLSYGQLLEKMNDSELALLAYLKHISFGYNVLSADFNFQKIHNEHIHPLLKTLNPGKYIKQFYASEKERSFSEPQLSMFLILLAKYDTASEHFQDIISAYRDKDEKEDFNLLIFTIKLSIWLKLCEGNFQDVLRLTELYIDYIKTLEKTNQKENEVSNFSLNLFKIQINSDIDSENIKDILQRLKEQKGVPFSDIFFKIWTCLNEPDSVEAQRFLNEKAIAEVVKELKKKQSAVNFICALLPG